MKLSNDLKLDTFMKKLHFVFFELSHSFKTPMFYQVLLLLYEKACLMSPFVLMILNATPWEYANNIIVKMGVLSSIMNEVRRPDLYCYTLVGIINFFIALLLYWLVFPKTRLKILKYAVSFGFPFVFFVLTQIVISLVFYCFVMLRKPVVFSAYKQVPLNIFTPYSSTHFVIMALMIITFIECIMLDLLYIFLYQEDKLTLWRPKGWQFALLGLIIKILIMCEYFLDSDNSYDGANGLGQLVVFGTRIMLRFYYPLPFDPFFEIAELFYDTCSIFMKVLILLARVVNFISLSDFYHYCLTFPIYSAFVCILRLLIKVKFFELGTKSKDNELDYIRELLEICHSTEDSAMVKLVILTHMHKKKCTKSSCACRSLLDKSLLKSLKVKIDLNNQAYETSSNIPEKIAKSWKLEVLKLLVNDADSLGNKSDSLCLALAELSFYYFANIFKALMYIGAIEAQKPNIQLRQFTMNLRRIINYGLPKDSEETEKILQSLKFQRKYNKFLLCIEDSCECTIKFWSSLLTENPNPSVLRKLGKELFDKRNDFLKIANEITDINAHHAEFLVKLGLYMKLILHDKTGATSTFHRIVFAAENVISGFLVNDKTFSIFRNDCKIVMVIVSLEQDNFFRIIQTNNETENVLGFNRENLIGFSATKLMLPVIANHHLRWIKNFFQNMGSSTIGIEKLRFIQHQEDYLVPCKATKRIVPSLKEGVRGIVLFYENTKMNAYTAQKTDKTKKKFGAILYDSQEKVIGITCKAKTMLGLNDKILQVIKNSFFASSLFPELKNSKVIERMKTPQGAVILLQSGHIQIEEYQLDLGIGEKETIEKKLLWTRIVEEKYEDDEIFILVFSPVMMRRNIDYAANPEYENMIYERISLHRNSTMSLPIFKKNEVEVEKIDLKMNIGLGRNIPDMNSETSERSPSTISRESMQSVQQIQTLSNELQVGAISKETPVLIKRLSIFLIIFLLMIFALIIVESEYFYSEIDDLRERFQMIEYFQIRHELIVYMAASPRSYDTYRKGLVPSTFVGYCARTKIRADRALTYNTKTKLSFDKFKLDYDYEKIPIVDRSDTYYVSFNYALIKYVNEVYIFTGLNDYNLSRYCINNYVDQRCIENNDALNFCADNGFFSMRINQLHISKILMKDLLIRAGSGENTLYTIISICMGIVLIASFFIVFILIWIIKDKSYVMSIFAGISSEEINIIINYAKSLPISKVQFYPKYAIKCDGNEDLYWKLLIRKNRRRSLNMHNARLSIRKTQVQNNDVLVLSPENTPESPKKVDTFNNACSPKNVKRQGTIDNVRDLSSPTCGKENGNMMHEDNIEHNEHKEKQERKKEALGKTDPELRNLSICRLGIVILGFVVYGSASIYFNYYIHDFNRSTCNFFYDLSKRNVYGMSLTALMRESVRSKNKTLIMKNTGNEEEMLGQDYLDEMMHIESVVREYSNIGDGRIFANYFALTAILDTPEYCKYVDSYQIGQSATCDVGYGGPKMQGLTIGMAYYLDYHVMYMAKIMAADFSNENVYNSILTDAGLSSPGSALITYIQPALELQFIEYRKDAVNFYVKIQVIVLTKMICFLLLFAIIYIFVIMRLLEILKLEIWLTHGMLNMIPLFVLKHNLQVQHQVWQRKHIS